MRRVSVMFLGLMLLLVGCSSSEQSSLADGVLTVGMECDYAPYNFTTNGDDLTEVAYDLGDGSYCEGYDVWMSTNLAQQLGVELEIKKIAWDGLIPALNAGQIDAIIGGMSPTAERKEVVSFSDAYFESMTDIVLVVNSSSDYASAKSLNDLEGMKISTQMGTFHSDLVTQATGAEVIDPMADFNTLLQATSSGVLDGYIAEKPVALSQTANNDSVVLVDLVDGGFVLDESQTSSAIAIRKEDVELTEQLNTSLATISTDDRVEMMDYYNSRGE